MSSSNPLRSFSQLLPWRCSDSSPKKRGGVGCKSFPMILSHLPIGTINWEGVLKKKRSRSVGVPPHEYSK